MAAIGEPFASGDSFLHRMDPRIRLLCAGLLTIPAALLQNIDQASASLTIGVLLALLGQLPMRLASKRLIVVNTFILFLWLFLPFSTPGESMWNYGPFNLTNSGILLAALITIKSNGIVLTLMALIGTIKVQDLGPAMQQLRIPNKLCHILLFTYRYIFVIHQEYQTMRQAMSARGFKPRTDTHTYRTYAWLVGMLLVKSWDRAERVHAAMRCRGFRGQFYSLTTFTTSKRDYVFLGICLLATIGIESLEIIKRGLA
ncbi:cobalt ECF transporter T component CbiQ [Pseudodesulfovibrio sp. zrk46]|uniref:cobalt ECF transporter T component CbiQ n=1 Tax=Pseudodesulfovibrio sp. zrk46 TaxID=2725288 RepID=UPI0014492C1C|nr:cobalt ECF transporter T component CbiQ [Pseudodesulfovibrio sp. zrk46]QJB57833.1 cobalt ECF transporter T component CbiQ [Pseudodesulfovibrio sp. zrk46]